MKKYLLSFILSIIWFVWFSNAVSISCNWNSNETSCSPYWYDSPYVADEEITVKLTSVWTCYDENLISIDTPNSVYWYSDLLNWITVNWWESVSFFYYTSSEETQSCQFNVSFWNDSEWWDLAWWILPDWDLTFSSLLSSLWSTLWEVIYYVVYIWLWILSCIIWFVAIKWLISWIWKKIRF